MCAHFIMVAFIFQALFIILLLLFKRGHLYFKVVIIPLKALLYSTQSHKLFLNGENMNLYDI